MSKLDIPIRLSGALRILDVAKTLKPRALEAGRISPDAASMLDNDFSLLVPFIDRSEVHSADEIEVIETRVTFIAGFVKAFSDLLTPAEKTRYAEGEGRFTGEFLKKVRQK